MSAFQGVNLAVRFLLELAALAALAYAGWSLAAPTPVRVLAAVALPVVAAVVWGAFVAPKAARRLPDPARLVVEAGVFGSAVTGLLLAGRTGWAVVLAGIVVANEILLFVWDQRDH